MLGIFTVKLQETAYYENQIHINLAKFSFCGNKQRPSLLMSNQPGFPNKRVMDYKLSVLHFNEVYHSIIH